MPVRLGGPHHPGTVPDDQRSVRGGIAAHNTTNGASVVLEERIAVGDPGCRVVVYAGEAPAASRRFAHRYLGPSPQDPPSVPDAR